jgi:pyridoxamine 5'-phosphate oxidase
MSSDLSGMRREYVHGELRRSQLDANPILQFEKWFEEGSKTAIEPSAMALATCDENGRPSVRMVLLKGFDELGFNFATNYESRKGQEITANAQAALLFFWADLERQVRAVGRVERLTEEESDAIFMARPRPSRLAAISSRQSEPAEGRSQLEEQVRMAEADNEGSEVRRPSFWGGYRILPDEFEFWQGRRNRLHDRFRYLREGSDWSIDRLQP